MRVFTWSVYERGDVFPLSPNRILCLCLRNQTGIKHWRLNAKNGKFYWGASAHYDSLDAFVQVRGWGKLRWRESFHLQLGKFAFNVKPKLFTIYCEAEITTATGQVHFVVCTECLYYTYAEQDCGVTRYFSLSCLASFREVRTCSTCIFQC